MQRNNCIDFMKCIAAFLVITIHKPFPGFFGEVFTPFARVAVPFFFMVSGYYLGDFRDLRKKIGKTAMLLFMANLAYFLWDILLVMLKGNSIGIYLDKTFSVENLLLFLCVNESPFAVHLWYLGALLYAESFVLLLSFLKKCKRIYFLIPFLLLTDLVFGKYSLLLFQREFDYIYVRNFAFLGIPYLLLGDFLRLHREKIKTWKDSFLLPCIFLFALTTLLEKCILSMLSLNAARDHYISTTFLCLLLFAFAIKHPHFGENTRIAYWGKHDSLIIYLIHPFLISLLGYLLKKNTHLTLYHAIAPLLIAGLSLLLSFLFRFLSSRLFFLQNRRRY